MTISLHPSDVGSDPKVTGEKVTVPYATTAITVRYLDADGLPAERTGECGELRDVLRKSGYEVQR